jgi:GT2 family glycosyltransferase
MTTALGPQVTHTEAPILSVVLGTYNRIDQLKRCLNSILAQTSVPIRVYVSDAGSTDGTVEYLQGIATQTIVPLLVGKRLGQARAYNEVFEMVDTPYVCWLSDDNEVVDRGLERALEILQADAGIGMVALKTKDLEGPFVGAPYIGGVSAAGILNVNQGMLPAHVLRGVGGFSEEFRDYGIDPALTAEVLFAGFKVVYTRKVTLHHYRNWSQDPTSENYKWLQQRHKIARDLYLKRYCTGAGDQQSLYGIKRTVAGIIRKYGSRILRLGPIRSSSVARTALNILTARYISLFDPVLSMGKQYHLVQRIPAKLLRRGLAA